MLIATAGMQADAKALHKTLQVRMGSTANHMPAGCCNGAQIHLARLLEWQIHGSLVSLLLLQARAVQYQFAHRKPMNVSAAAQLLSNTLYYKRFFPYYTANLCCGLDKDGRFLATVTRLDDGLLVCMGAGHWSVEASRVRLDEWLRCTLFVMCRRRVRVHI